MHECHPFPFVVPASHDRDLIPVIKYCWVQEILQTSFWTTDQLNISGRSMELLWDDPSSFSLSFLFFFVW